jgi:hypothetical protein
MSIHDAVAGALQRLQAQVPDLANQALTPAQALPLLTAEQRQALATQYIRFTVNQPVVVSIARDIRWGAEPFWLQTEDFQKTDKMFEEAGTTFDIGEKEFISGDIGLGVNSLTGGGIHYLVTVRPQQENPEAPLEISALYPKQLRLQQSGAAVQPFVDNNYVLTALPPALAGQQLIRLVYARRDQAKVLNTLHRTQFPAQAEPDQWVLTWSDDPRTTQTLQWRTDNTHKQLQVAVVPEADPAGFASQALRVREVEANAYRTPTTINDPVNHRFATTFSDLSPNTTYRYAWRAVAQQSWQPVGRFRTAPGGAVDFSFLYLGDAQNGLSTWHHLIQKADADQPEARFVLMAGDLVDRGNDRYDWDAFFAAAHPVFANKALVPVIGNHENQGGHPAMYLSLFRLLENGPSSIAPERAYAFEYGNALFVILDTNVPLATQTAWLERTLKASRAHWKFVSYHHPAYPSSRREINPEFQRQWLPLFDRYAVDFALQGHDHAYLRTYPMKGGQPIKSADAKGASAGTRYLISVSGTKMYPQEPRAYIEKGFTKIATYQVFELRVSADQLIYRAFDAAGTLRDEVIVMKAREGA